MSIEEETYDETANSIAADDIFTSTPDSSHPNRTVLAERPNLPPVPAGWIESVDELNDEVCYTHPAMTGARVSRVRLAVLFLSFNSAVDVRLLSVEIFFYFFWCGLGC